MRDYRLSVRLVSYADACGAQEELVGDLLEEIARGRSRRWVCSQVIGLYGCAFAKYVRTRARLRPHMVAIAFGVLVVTAWASGSISHVVEAWLGFYFVSGILSLFADMALQTVGARATILPGSAEVSNPDRIS